MDTGSVLKLYMTMPDLMRSGHRIECEDFECEPFGIVGDVNYEEGSEFMILLVSKKSYDIIEEAELVLDKGVLMENIYVDIDLNKLEKGSVIEIGEMLFEVKGACHAYDYLFRFAPELPELIQGNRGIYLSPLEYGRIAIGDSVRVVEEV